MENIKKIKFYKALIRKKRAKESDDFAEVKVKQPCKHFVKDPRTGRSLEKTLFNIGTKCAPGWTSVDKGKDTDQNGSSSRKDVCIPNTTGENAGVMPACDERTVASYIKTENKKAEKNPVPATRPILATQPPANDDDDDDDKPRSQSTRPATSQPVSTSTSGDLPKPIRKLNSSITRLVEPSEPDELASATEDLKTNEQKYQETENANHLDALERINRGLPNLFVQSSVDKNGVKSLLPRPQNLPQDLLKREQTLLQTSAQDQLEVIHGSRKKSLSRTGFGFHIKGQGEIFKNIDDHLVDLNRRLITAQGSRNEKLLALKTPTQSPAYKKLFELRERFVSVTNIGSMFKRKENANYGESYSDFFDTFDRIRYTMHGLKEREMIRRKSGDILGFEQYVPDPTQAMADFDQKLIGLEELINDGETGLNRDLASIPNPEKIKLSQDFNERMDGILHDMLYLSHIPGGEAFRSEYQTYIAEVKTAVSDSLRPDCIGAFMPEETGFPIVDVIYAFDKYGPPDQNGTLDIELHGTSVKNGIAANYAQSGGIEKYNNFGVARSFRPKENFTFAAPSKMHNGGLIPSRDELRRANVSVISDPTFKVRKELTQTDLDFLTRMGADINTPDGRAMLNRPSFKEYKDRLKRTSAPGRRIVLEPKTQEELNSEKQSGWIPAQPIRHYFNNYDDLDYNGRPLWVASATDHQVIPARFHNLYIAKVDNLSALPPINNVCKEPSNGENRYLRKHNEDSLVIIPGTHIAFEDLKRLINSSDNLDLSKLVKIPQSEQTPNLRAYLENLEQYANNIAIDSNGETKIKRPDRNNLSNQVSLNELQQDKAIEHIQGVLTGISMNYQMNNHFHAKLSHLMARDSSINNKPLSSPELSDFKSDLLAGLNFNPQIIHPDFTRAFISFVDRFTPAELEEFLTVHDTAAGNSSPDIPLSYVGIRLYAAYAAEMDGFHKMKQLNLLQEDKTPSHGIIPNYEVRSVYSKPNAINQYTNNISEKDDITKETLNFITHSELSPNGALNHINSLEDLSALDTNGISAGLANDFHYNENEQTQIKNYLDKYLERSTASSPDDFKAEIYSIINELNRGDLTYKTRMLDSKGIQTLRSSSTPLSSADIDNLFNTSGDNLETQLGLSVEQGLDLKNSLRQSVSVNPDAQNVLNQIDTYLRDRDLAGSTRIKIKNLDYEIGRKNLVTIYDKAQGTFGAKFKAASHNLPVCAAAKIEDPNRKAAVYNRVQIFQNLFEQKLKDAVGDQNFSEASNSKLKKYYKALFRRMYI